MNLGSRIAECNLRSTHLFEYSLVLAPVVSIGHISTAALAAITLGSMTGEHLPFNVMEISTEDASHVQRQSRASVSSSHSPVRWILYFLQRGQAADLIWWAFGHSE
jgi:hypothetical protein